MPLPERKGMNRRLKAGILAGMIITSALNGCRGYNSEPAEYNLNTSSEDEISVSNNVAAAEGRIMTGAAGYEKNGTKKALIECDGTDTDFAVIDMDTGEEAAGGRIRYEEKQPADGKAYGICNFSDLNKEGSFYIRTDSGICSGEFAIKEGLYKELLRENTQVSGKTGSGSDDITENNIRKCFLDITDTVLSREFFGSRDGKGNENKDNKNKKKSKKDKNRDESVISVPESIASAKLQVDALQKLVNEDGVLDKSLNEDTGTCYQYSAVMSLFAYEYEQYDREYADVCRKLSAEAFKRAEETYEKASKEDKEASDDKRFWAAAQLYKLTGEAGYKKAAESYADDPPAGFSEDRSGYLGTIAYLTSYNRIDLNVGEAFITELMEDINRVIKRESVDAFLTDPEEDREAEHVCEAYEAARLMVLGNYITKNIKYVETAESYLSYLYGMNMLCKDYAYSSSSDKFSEPLAFIFYGLIDSYIYEDKEPEAMNG